MFCVIYYGVRNPLLFRGEQLSRVHYWEWGEKSLVVYRRVLSHHVLSAQLVPGALWFTV